MSEKKGQSAILVVDDDQSIRETLKAILEQEGYYVEAAKDGSDALGRSEKKLFDLALVDMRLPDIMGSELLGKFKETTPKMRKVILTGYPSMQNAIDSVNEGADAYILKPVEAGVVLTTIKEQLKKRQDEASYSDKKVTEFIETRVRELDRQAQIEKPEKLHSK